MMARRELNMHMHYFHRGFYDAYDSAVDDGKEVMHSAAHTDGVMDRPHTHDILSGDPLWSDGSMNDADSLPVTDSGLIVPRNKPLERAINQHMWFGHHHADKRQHELIHASVHQELDHWHTWPLDLDELLSLNAMLKNEALSRAAQVSSTVDARLSR